MKKRADKPGFALISVLALVSVLVILLGALMGTNRATFGLLKVSQAKDRIDRTVSSVYSYSRFRLEHDYRWGKEPFDGDRRIWGHLRLTEVSSSGGEVQSLVGYDEANDTSFAVEICNNLKTNGEVATLKDVKVAGSRRDGVPTGFCRLEIKVDGSGHLDGAVVMVRNPGLVGGVCLANRTLEIDTSEFDLMTRDPIKNQARSLGETLMTGMGGFLSGQAPGAGPKLQGELSSGELSRDNPVLWAAQANQFRLGDNDSYAGREAFKARNSGLAFRDERFVDQANSKFDIPEVSLSDLAKVKRADGTDKDSKDVPPGLYRFEQFSMRDANGLEVGPVRVLTRRTLNAQNPEDTSGPVEQFWWKADGNPALSDSTVASRIGAPVSAGTRNESSRYTTINGQGGAMVDLESRRFVFDERYNFKVDGNFGLIGSSVNGDPDQRQVNPGIYFGNPDAIAAAGNFNVSGAANASNDTWAKGSLESTGLVHIQGDISGSTTIAAKGDVTIAAGRMYEPQGNSDVNFSIFSEGNVSFLPPPINEDRDDRRVDEQGQLVDEDGNPIRGDAGQEAMNVAEKDVRLTGLIYARGSVTIDLQDTKAETGTRRNFQMEGAIVAKQGSLSITNADRLRMIYNPEFTDQLIPSLSRAGQRRIEVTGWRTVKPSAFSAELRG